MRKKARHLYEFGPFRLDKFERVLTRDDAVVELEPKEFKVLLYFVENPGRLLSKMELQDRFWADTSKSAESNLTGCISELRKKLGELGHQYIRNVPKGGYRFAVEVHDASYVPDEACPWVGLSPVDQSHGQYFFGRDDEVQILTERVEQSNFLAVVGGSGLGKSSLVRAGLIPALERRGASVDSEWRCCVFEPTASPLQRLASELIQLAGLPPSKHNADSLAAALRSDSNALRNYIDNNIDASRTLLVIDQFEDFIRRYDNTPEQRAFVDNLLTAISDPRAGIHVIVAIRTDFYARLEQDPSLFNLWSKVAANDYKILKLLDKALRRIIEEPARLVGLEWDDALVDALVRDLHEEPGALSMLSQTMVELFKRREGIRLTYKSYEQSGGVQETIKNKAEEVFASFGEREQDHIRQIIINLTDVAERPEHDVKARVSLDDLVGDLEDYDQINSIIRKLADERLLVTSNDYETSSVDDGRPKVWVEASHDALIRYWPRARNWLNEKRDAKLMFDGLDAAAREWDRARKEGDKERGAANLFRGSKLDSFLDAQSSFIDFLRPIHHEFLDASKRLRDKERAAEYHRREVNEQRRKWKRIAVAAGVIVIAFVVFSIFLISKTREANRQSAEANRQRNFAGSLLRAADSRSQLQFDPELSLLLAIESGKLVNNGEAQSALRQAIAATHLRGIFAGHSAPVIGIAVSRDGRYLLTGGADNEARLWDIPTRKTIQTFKGHKGWVYWVAFSPDEKSVVTASHDSTVVIWDKDTAKVLHTLKHEKAVNNAVFSADGSKILTACDDNIARIWDIKTEKVVVTLKSHTSWINTAVYSPDGKLVVTGSGDHTAKVWEAQNGNLLRTLEQHSGSVLSVAFSPDGKKLVTGSSDKLAIVWNADTWRPERELHGHSLAVFSTEFSPDSRMILTSSKDSTARLWNASTGFEYVVFKGHHSTVNTAVFGADGHTIFTASGDKTARVWDSEVLPPPLLLNGHTAPVYSAVFSPDGTRILTASQDKTARIWNAFTGKQIAELRHSDSVQDGVFSPDGKRIATASQDHIARLWDAETGDLKKEFAGHTDMIHTVRFSSDGTRLVTASQDTTAIVWDVNTGAKVQVLTGHTKEVYDATFSSDGNTIATAGHDGVLRIWKMKDGTELFKRDIGYAVNAVKFSKDGKYLLAACADQTTRVWNLSDQTNFAVLLGHEQWVNQAEFNSEATLVASASGDQTARIWDLGLGEELFRLNFDASVMMVSFSQDGERLVAATKGGSVALYDCKICRASQNELLNIAAHLTVRTMTPEENRRFLGTR